MVVGNLVLLILVSWSSSSSCSNSSRSCSCSFSFFFSFFFSFSFFSLILYFKTMSIKYFRATIQSAVVLTACLGAYYISITGTEASRNSLEKVPVVPPLL